MFRVLIGSIVGGVAMFVIGFIFWATPLNRIAYSGAGDQQGANVQLALANNLPHVGRYLIPNPDTANGTVLYGKGPVAIVDYNPQGYSTADPKGMLGGLIHEIVVAGLMGFSLFGIASRVPDFAGRAKLVIGFSAAGCVLLALSDPIWEHASWGYAIYDLIAALAMMIAPGLLIARWFLPKAPAVTLH